MTWLFAIGRFLKGLPWQVWAALALALIVWRGIAWHAASVADALKQADKSGYDRAMGEMKAYNDQITIKSLALQAKTVERQANINQEVGKTYATATDALRSSADALRLRFDAEAQARPSPGQAGGAAVPGRAAGAEGQPGAGDGGLALVPIAPLIDHAERCDLTNKALIAYEDWYAKHSVAYEAWRAEYERALRKP